MQSVSGLGFRIRVYSRYSLYLYVRSSVFCFELPPSTPWYVSEFTAFWETQKSRSHERSFRASAG